MKKNILITVVIVLAVALAAVLLWREKVGPVALSPTPSPSSTAPTPSPTSPTPRENTGQTVALSVTVSASGNMRVYEPDPGDTVNRPLVLKGDGRFFEGVYHYRLRDSDGTVLAQGQGIAGPPDLDNYRTFEVTLNYDRPRGDEGKLEVFAISARDGSEIDKVVITVQFR